MQTCWPCVCVLRWHKTNKVVRSREPIGREALEPTNHLSMRGTLTAMIAKIVEAHSRLRVPMFWYTVIVINEDTSASTERWVRDPTGNRVEGCDAAQEISCKVVACESVSICGLGRMRMALTSSLRRDSSRSDSNDGKSKIQASLLH